MKDTIVNQATEDNRSKSTMPCCSNETAFLKWPRGGQGRDVECVHCGNHLDISVSSSMSLGSPER